MAITNWMWAETFAGIAIGGDVFPGSTLSDHVLRFNNIPQVIPCWRDCSFVGASSKSRLIFSFCLFTYSFWNWILPSLLSVKSMPHLRCFLTEKTGLSRPLVKTSFYFLNYKSWNAALPENILKNSSPILPEHQWLNLNFLHHFFKVTGTCKEELQTLKIRIGCERLIPYKKEQNYNEGTAKEEDLSTCSLAKQFANPFAELSMWSKSTLRWEANS